ncbi:carbonic anhydrase 1-like [Diorhabda carinulata]|uniref:carbonic anhydrase 1-like n=1 Tax=Diorhabda carinulata TaxID=1163345 RepID=UPI0025A053FA|nr:carbonic anhydrase 1-like [Diorhabda carinulata]
MSEITFKLQLIQFVIYSVLFTYQLGHGQDFGYEGTIGPDFWGIKYRGCNGGKLQSPIDIEINNVKNVSYPPLIFKHFDEPLETVKLVNNGHTVQLSIQQGNIPSIGGGPLNSTYNFYQLHFHWGKNDSEGSENLINNHSFPLELHIVFYKTDYGNFSNALGNDDGLTVLSFLYNKTDEENKKYYQFEKDLPLVENFTASIDIINFDSLDDFTTTDRTAYFTYHGSLTTPPCSEVVTWIEFANTIPLSHEQIQEFRLLSTYGGRLNHNFRPIQATNDRVIYMNVPQKSSSSSNYENQTNLLLILFLFQMYIYFYRMKS